MDKLLTYAVRYSKVFPVSSALVQTSCGCVCPACGEAVVLARDENGNYGFKHKSSQACADAAEYSFSFAAADLLKRAGEMYVPPVYLYYINSRKEREEIIPSRKIKIKDVRLKKRFDKPVPDIFVLYEGGSFYLRIAAREIGSNEMEKITGDGVSTLELTLPKVSGVLLEEKFEKMLTENSVRKIWIHNMYAVWCSRLISGACEEKKISNEDLSFPVVYDCPVSVKMLYGRTYADYKKDCYNCEFNFRNDFENGTLLCAGKQKIGSVKDFKISEEVRLSQNNDGIPYLMRAQISDGVCPRCGYPLVKKYGSHGCFYGCSAFPECKFTFTLDERTGQIKYNPERLE